jgi:hypothetical protein
MAGMPIDDDAHRGSSMRGQTACRRQSPAGRRACQRRNSSTGGRSAGHGERSTVSGSATLSPRVLATLSLAPIWKRRRGRWGLVEEPGPVLLPMVDRRRRNQRRSFRRTSAALEIGEQIACPSPAATISRVPVRAGRCCGKSPLRQRRTVTPVRPRRGGRLPHGRGRSLDSQVTGSPLEDSAIPRESEAGKAALGLAGSSDSTSGECRRALEPPGRQSRRGSQLRGDPSRGRLPPATSSLSGS